MSRSGRVPLPPYIAREPRPADELRYQTVYAKREGSVAAPTAGLHFTNELLDALSARGVVIAGLDLEVGPGTFKPVETEPLEQHQMHAERYDIPERLAALTGEVRRLGGRIWAVGTTVVRALETVADDRGVVRAGQGWTKLVVSAERGVRVVDGLLTGWHEPRASHLLMLEAVAGRELLEVSYRAALERGYLWHEFGDLHLLMP